MCTLYLSYLAGGNYRICSEHGLPFTVKELDFASREQAINWIIDNQLGRRNLAPFQMSILRGKRYNAEKQAHGGAREASCQNDNLRASETLAAQYGVSPRTITRDGDFAKAPNEMPYPFVNFGHST